VTLRARWVMLRARWVTLRARWVTLRARWVTLRARWVTFTAAATLRAAAADEGVGGLDGELFGTVAAHYDAFCARRALAFCDARAVDGDPLLVRALLFSPLMMSRFSRQY
jgi:hypothetical protein